MPNATEEETPKFQLSLVQVIAAGLASITSAVILSKFGVTGTYIGTAIGSVLSTVGVAVYSHTMRRARSQVTRVTHHRRNGSSQPGTSAARASAAQGTSAAWNRRQLMTRTPAPAAAARSPLLAALTRWFSGLPLWAKTALSAAAVFLLAVAAIVVFQFLSGYSLINVWGQGTSSGRPDAGCVVGRCAGPAATPTGTAAPTPLATTAAPTAKPTPLPSLTPTPTAKPTPPPTPTPTASPQAAVTPPGAPVARSTPPPSSS